MFYEYFSVFEWIKCFMNDEWVAFQHFHRHNTNFEVSPTAYVMQRIYISTPLCSTSLRVSTI